MPRKSKKSKKAPKAQRSRASEEAHAQEYNAQIDKTPAVKTKRASLAGLVSSPTNIIAKFKGNDLPAILLPEGQIEFAGKEYDSPSMAAKAATDGASINGWMFWKIEQDGEWVPIDVLRKKKAA